MKLSHFITFFFLFYNADSFAQNTILEQKLHTNWQFQQKGTKKWLSVMNASD